MNDIRTSLAPEVQSLLQQMDQAVVSTPPEHRERILRELLADLHLKVAALYHPLPKPSLPPSDSMGQLRELRRELMALHLKIARLGINAPHELEARRCLLEDAIRGVEEQMKTD
jgi:hypothetical protein